MCPLLITNNTGPAHIAAGVNTPIIDIYARTNPQHTPWMVKSKVLYFDVPCKACARGVCPQDHSSVQKSVEPADIFLEVKKILNISDERSDFTYSYI
jgi:ADP-heptose:LPS heptosyltransferase